MQSNPAKEINILDIKFNSLYKFDWSRNNAVQDTLCILVLAHRQIIHAQSFNLNLVL